MNLKHLSLFAALCGTTVGALAGTHIGIGLTIGVPAPIVVREAPPRPVVETVVVAPGPGYVWVRGHYSWAKSHWVWIRGAWMLPPRPAAVWVEGSWEPHRRHWIEGHWEVRAVPAPVVVAPPVPAATVVITAPPPPRAEVLIARPSPHHVWIAGYWVWRGGHHVWIAGHWELPPRAHTVWVAPRWERHGRNYVFVEGRWR